MTHAALTHAACLDRIAAGKFRCRHTGREFVDHGLPIRCDCQPIADPLAAAALARAADLAARGIAAADEAEIARRLARCAECPRLDLPGCPRHFPGLTPCAAAAAIAALLARHAAHCQRWHAPTQKDIDPCKS